MHRRYAPCLRAAMLLLALALLVLPRPGQARLDPYYVIHGQGAVSISPRVLVVLDNSGSMAMDETYVPDAQYPNTKCWWDNCENADAGVLQSRIHAARDVIETLVAANEDKAEFALMTFGNTPPPDGSKDLAVPEPCEALVNNGPLKKGKTYRFTWVETYVNNQPGDNNISNYHTDILNPFGTQGAWTLCGDNRPFPYLRHDQLGGFSMPNDSNAPLADQPLYVTESDEGDYRDAANYSRPVQFFPRWIGRRGNLDCNDPAQKLIAANSLGDFDGNNNAQKLANVCDHDFYYWPYVDGDPGYSYYSGYSQDTMWHVECDDNNNCGSTTSQSHRLGVNRRNQSDGVSLFVPFYSEAVLGNDDIPAADKGPLDPGDQDLMFTGLTSESYAGGLDVTGGTPWAVAIGDVDYMVKTNAQGQLAPKPALAMSNAAFSHTTVASYLSFLTVATDSDICRPTAAILRTAGQPDLWDTQGGTKLYQRLGKLRNKLGVKTYMVGFSDGAWNSLINWERMHHIACAAAGSDDDKFPCDGESKYDWDTCRDS
ncbi:MAG: VWA domain-containing protein, partial [Myxococcales bacterium]|nr:VWA domain-containing protein [Myxococcales bacterium]